MIKILSQNRQLVAILENAYDIGYEKEFNAVWTSSFSLPLTDEKNEHCKPFNYVEVYDNGEYVGLFRIMPKYTVKNESQNYVSYECEHVLGLLLNTQLFRDHQLTNLNTTQVLTYLLDKQKVKHWKLGTVAFSRGFSYLWENENLLSAIFSVPKPFDVPFEWSWDTTSYPWTLELLEPSTVAAAEIRERKNLKGLEVESNPMDMYNRIYPLGVGEGINQLNIMPINNGSPYVEDAASVAEYGPIEYIFSDRRFTDQVSLKATAEALLKKWKEPIVSWNISAADLSSITGEAIDKFRVGKIVRLNVEGFPVTDLRIMKESKYDVTGRPGDIQLEVGNVVEDLGTTYADLRERQRINELVANGATNLLSYSYNDNCDNDDPAVIKFYLPEEMVKINKVLLTFGTDYFRAYSKSAKAGGGVVKSTESGGGDTTESGGGDTTEAGGGDTSSEDGDHRHVMFSATGFQATTDPNLSVVLTAANGLPIYVGGDTAAGLEYLTEGSSGKHHHTMDPHVHQTKAHVHQTKPHVHEIKLDPHVHPLEYGIYKHTSLPTKITIKVDGNTVPGTSLSAEDLDLMMYLSKDSEGRINRGWHEIALYPDNLGRINANVITQFFLQSRGSYAL